MAEAVVEDIPQPPQRFYCHLCSVEIDNVTTDFNCPHCSNGFIEELPNVVENRLDDVEMPELDPTGYVDISNRFTDEISSLLMSVTGTRPMDLDLDEQESQSSVTNSGRGGRRGRRRYVHNLNNFNNILHEFLISVTGGAGATGTPMFFMGNPGDYAWGREGLDTIVTQLLNQMETTGPPPLTTEKIGEIPKVEITMDQVNEKLQCSVCWEDFQLKEFVRKLPCLHVYHESCIVPWLELHGTCPICRQSLSNENPEEQQRNTLSAAAAAAANSIRNVAALYRADSTQTPSYSQNQQVGESSTQTTSSTATTSTTTNDARQQNLQSQLNQTSNRSSGFRDDDGNIDYEFD